MFCFVHFFLPLLFFQMVPGADLHDTYTNNQRKLKINFLVSYKNI